jgi:hypothetical protein
MSSPPAVDADVVRAALLGALQEALQQELAAVHAQAEDTDGRLRVVEGQIAVVHECVLVHMPARASSRDCHPARAFCSSLHAG